MPLDDILLDAEESMEKAIEHLRHDLRAVRTGRATPALVENIKVEYYGTPTDLRSIASISDFPSDSPFSMYSRVRIVDFKISIAAILPFPSASGIRRCETIKRNDCATRVRIAFSSFFGNTPMLRSTVLDASIVCNVDNTR